MNIFSLVSSFIGTKTVLRKFLDSVQSLSRDCAAVVFTRRGGVAPPSGQNDSVLLGFV